MSNTSGHYDVGKEDASRAAWDMCVASFSNSPFVDVVRLTEWEFHFRDPRGFQVTDRLPFVADIKAKMRAILDDETYEQATGWLFLPKWYTQTLCADGIGTKVEMANALYSLYKILANVENKYGGQLTSGFRMMARNLIAMSADDIARHGGISLVYSNVIDYSKLSDDEAIAYQELMLGLGDVLRKQGIVLLSGESAGLRQFVGSENPNAFFPFNWSGVMYGLYHDKLKITGEEVEEWDYIVVLEQPGIWSNGVTKIREALAIGHGKEWYNNPKALKDVEEAAIPCIVYAKLIADANGWNTNGERKINMTSVSHLSGGGLTDKFLRPVLGRKWLSAELSDLYRIPEIVRKSTEWLHRVSPNFTIQQAPDTWAIWQRMAITVRWLNNAENLISIAKNNFWINAQIWGVVTRTSKDQSPHLDITARFQDGSNDQQLILAM